MAKTASGNSGFAFKIEEGIPIPERRSGSGTQKYDWGQFTKPGQSAEVPVTSPKTLYSSIKKYRDRLKKEGAKATDIPEFTVTRNMVDGKIKSCRVFRTK